MPTTTNPCHAATSGDGYWTCDTLGGCADCRQLARELSDTEQLAEWDAAKANATVTVTLTAETLAQLDRFLTEMGGAPGYITRAACDNATELRDALRAGAK